MKEPDRTVDAIGLLCPLPVLKARKALAEMRPGQVLEVRATDPMARVDVPHMAREDGHAVLSESLEDGNVTRFLIAKRG